MYNKILVPTDGSEIATTAGEAAIALAQQFNASIEVIYVHESNRLEESSNTEKGTQDQSGRDALEKIENRAADTHIDVATTLINADTSEPVHRVILEFADAHSIGSIVMGTHGRTGVGRVVLGSVTERTLRESPVPVITLHENTNFDPDIDSLLVPTDGSDTAEAALDHGIDLALATDATLYIVNVVDVGAIAGSFNVGDISEKLKASSNQAVEAAVQRAEDAGVSLVESATLVGVPDRSICDYADEHDMSAIVMGTHGRTGVERFFLGSVTERVVRRSNVPVIGTKATAPKKSTDMT